MNVNHKFIHIENFSYSSISGTNEHASYSWLTLHENRSKRQSTTFELTSISCVNVTYTDLFLRAGPKCKPDTPAPHIFMGKACQMFPHGNLCLTVWTKPWTHTHTLSEERGLSGQLTLAGVLPQRWEASRGLIDSHTKFNVIAATASRNVVSMVLMGSCLPFSSSSMYI